MRLRVRLRYLNLARNLRIWGSTKEFGDGLPPRKRSSSFSGTTKSCSHLHTDRSKSPLYVTTPPQLPEALQTREPLPPLLYFLAIPPKPWGLPSLHCRPACCGIEARAHRNAHTLHGDSAQAAALPRGCVPRNLDPLGSSLWKASSLIKAVQLNKNSRMVPVMLITKAAEEQPATEKDHINIRILQSCSRAQGNHGL